MKKIFLGGTCNGSTWRDDLIPHIKHLDFYNPVVPNWSVEDDIREQDFRKIADINLFVITPKTAGFYSFAEVTEEAILNPSKTVFCWLENDGELEFNKKQKDSLNAIGRLVERNGAIWVSNFQSLKDLLQPDLIEKVWN